MNNLDQTACPTCKGEYSEKNPPRLLTMCGHTFCEKCIKELMPKKKANGKARVICPIDKKSIQLCNPNPSLFPKNIALLHLNHSSKHIASADSTPCESSMGKVKSQSLTTNQEIHPNEGQVSSEKLLHEILFGALSDICLLHQKPLDLICVRDCQKICTSCAIFGEHKGHPVKNIKEVDQMAKVLEQKLKNYLDEQKTYNQKMDPKELKGKIESLIAKRKIDLEKEIVRKFKEIMSEVQHQEQRALSKLDRVIEDTRAKIKGDLEDKITIKEHLGDWIKSLGQSIKVLQKQEEEQKLKLVLKPESYLETCEKNIEILKELSADMLKEAEKSLDNLTVICESREIKKYIKEHCKVVDSSNSFLDMSMSMIKGNVAKTGNEESLLDDLEESMVLSGVRPATQRMDRSECKTRRKEDFVKPETNPRMSNRIKSSQKLFSTSQKKSSLLKSSRLFSKDSSKHLPILGPLKLKQIPEKYESKIEPILKGQSDVLDLTNAELGNEKVLYILETIKAHEVTIAKLVRNKLDNDFLPQAIPLLNNIAMLNISRNELTERALSTILKSKQEGMLSNLKSLMIGQNKIVERNNKDVIEELRKMGLNVCM